jgi:hypothetical protein
MKTHSLTYETSWRCTHCKASGIVSVSTDVACDKLFEEVVMAHAERSSDCAVDRGTSGLAVQPAKEKEGLR